VLKRFAAEKAEQRSVGRPDDARAGVEDRKPRPRVTRRPGAECHGDSAARNEAGDEDEFAAAFGQLAFSPANRLAPFLAAEKAGLGVGAESVADEVRGVVAGERTASRGHDEEGEVEVPGGGDHAARYHHCFAGHDRQQCVQQRENERDGIGPPRCLCDELRELVKHVDSRSGGGDYRSYPRDIKARPAAYKRHWPASRAP